MDSARVLSIISWVNLATSVVMLFSVIRLHGHAWKTAGRHKLLWLLLSVVSFFVFLSIPVAIWYYARTRPPVAAADADCINTRRNTRATRATRVQAAGTTAPASQDWMSTPARQTCGSCSGGKQSCWTCGGRGSVQDYDSTFKNCSSCMGTGHTTCAMCNGTGYR